MDLSCLSDEELKDLYKKTSNKIAMYDSTQNGLKTLLNSGYGATASPNFRYFKTDIAEGITSTGQFIIQHIGKMLTDFFTELTNEEFEWVIASDTDSVVGDTVIRVNGKYKMIADFWHELKSKITLTDSGCMVKKVKNKKASAFCNGKAVDENINYVMRHLVKKNMFQITAYHNETGQRAVTVTEDHSIIVERDNKIVELKPADILKTDVIIMFSYGQAVRTSEFTIKDLGIVEKWVYDIEVENCHNFFANDILVHNSVYLSLSPVVQKWNSQQKLSKAEIVSKLDEFCENTIQPFIVEKYNEIAKYSNLYENRLAMKREAIADAAIWRAKKNYIIQIWDNEGVRYKEPKIKTMGVEAKRSSTPALIKKKLVECYDILINKTEKDIQKYIKDFRAEYENLDLETIAFPRGVSDIDKWYDGNGGWASGTPIHVKASVVYNNLVVQTKTEHKYQKVTNGTKIKFIYLKQPNKTFNNCIGFVDELPQEFDLHDHIDYNTQFTKSFLDPVTSFTNCIGWKTEPTVDMFSFFGGESSQEKVEVVKPRTKQITKQSSLSEFFN